MYQAINDKVMFKLFTTPEKIDSIYLPANLKNKDGWRSGEVITSGDKNLQPKDIIFFHKAFIIRGSEVNDNSFIKSQNIIAYVRNGNLCALRDDTIIKLIVDKKIGDSPIILPNYNNVVRDKGNYYGELVSLGKDYPRQIEKGAKLIFPRNEGKQFVYNGDVYFTLKERWVLAKLDQ